MPKSYFAYTRVSTARQGERGVSLQEQQNAIAQYANRNSLNIVAWFEERVTAAKCGRPIFSQMLKQLRRGHGDGLIIHKIDRSARNLKDWADLGELMDAGTDVQFVTESLDVRSRGGRLSADIQAVVAADFIRNLREETRKGFYGRLKQGLYPLPAPLGYRNVGPGQTKVADPVKAPLIRKAFELYASGRYSLESLIEELFRLGLRNRNGGRVTRNGLSTILNNPFYVGLVRIRRTGETFAGGHKPLVAKPIFDRVQAILRGKTRRTVGYRHELLFRRLLRCAHCDQTVIGEKQKGHVYYRCHTKDCPTTCIREEIVETGVLQKLEPLKFNEEEKEYLRQKVLKLKAEWEQHREEQIKAMILHLDQVQDRINRLTDAYLDGLIERELFEQRKSALLMQQRGLKEEIDGLETGTAPAIPDRLSELGLIL